LFVIFTMLPNVFRLLPPCINGLANRFCYDKILREIQTPSYRKTR